MALSGKGKWILQMNRGWVGKEQVDQVKGIGWKQRVQLELWAFERVL